jgi:dTDP-4-amino-4,6-dideoxygalactose transaminase
MLNQSRTMTHISSITKKVISNSDVDEYFKRRRMNYGILADKLSDASEFTLVRKELMPEECPMGLPVLVKNRRLWQHALKEIDIEALPLWELYPIVNRLQYSEAAKIADEILVFPVSHEYDDWQVESMADKILTLQKAI